jgi:hydroxylamine reductase
MFCYQCEQTFKGLGCDKYGVCGKDPDTASMQDLLIHALKGISIYALKARELGKKDIEIDRFVVDNLFTTITNVNFDVKNVEALVDKGYEIKNKAQLMYETACLGSKKEVENLGPVPKWVPMNTTTLLVAQGNEFGIAKDIKIFGKDIGGLRHLILYGLKGMAAYAHHAYVLGIEDDDVYGFFHEALSLLASDENNADELVKMALKCGEVNFKIMEMLDKANTNAYGNPVPTKVRITPVKGKAILISGHDLKDLYELLKQTEGKGINVYTHGEMLPAHGYPKLKKYKHLVGNYGGAWQNQVEEFDNFPGAVLMTTNCIQKPKISYQARIFTTGLVEMPGVVHISDKDFFSVIEAALKGDGFKADEPEKSITVGFGHNAVLGVVDKVIDAVKSGKIKHFFLVGGCDGAKPGRNYYTDFAQKVPKDCVILTIACGKYRFNKLEFGDIDGIPRLLDIGQCNDAYSAIKIAVALAGAFKTDVNSLPLTLILSWYEQKAVCILLTLLHLGIKNIKLGPSMPAFVTSDIYEVIKNNFNLVPVTDADSDLKEILAK